MDFQSIHDTPPEIEAILVAGYRAMSPTKKLERVCALNRAAQRLALADVRRRYPDADERELELRVAARWIPPDLMLHAFGWSDSSAT